MKALIIIHTYAFMVNIFLHISFLLLLTVPEIAEREAKETSVCLSHISPWPLAAWALCPALVAFD